MHAARLPRSPQVIRTPQCLCNLRWALIALKQYQLGPVSGVLLSSDNPKYQSRRTRSSNAPRLQASSSSPPTSPAPTKTQKPEKPDILTRILSISSVPYTSYVPHPAGFMHRASPEMKQLWTVALLVLVTRAPPPVRLAIPFAIAALTLLSLPDRLGRPQLTRLAVLCAFIFVLTAMGAESVPPILADRSLPSAAAAISTGSSSSSSSSSSLLSLFSSFSSITTNSITNLSWDGLPETLIGKGGSKGYRYVLLNLGIFTITKRGINLALTISALMFTALQTASLCLVTTPPEHIARAVGKGLSPLGWIGVPVRELTLTVLLALRFMATVFDESRNICLGLASRGVDWKDLGMKGTIGLSLGSVTQLFSNLMLKCGSISQAMAARGFVGPEEHEMYLPSAPGFGRCWEDYGLVMFVGGVVLIGYYV